jgi:hypothetical protein
MMKDLGVEVPEGKELQLKKATTDKKTIRPKDDSPAGGRRNTAATKVPSVLLCS